jgi:hypothetical protein
MIDGIIIEIWLLSFLLSLSLSRQNFPRRLLLMLGSICADKTHLINHKTNLLTLFLLLCYFVLAHLAEETMARRG